MPIQDPAIDSGKVDEITKQEIVYRDYVERKIEEGTKAAEEGRIISHAQVKRLFTAMINNGNKAKSAH